MIKQKLITAVVGGVAMTFGAFVIESPERTTPALSAYQQRCAQALSVFVSQIVAIDGGRYSVTFGEAFRPASVARDYAMRGIGIANSLHTQRLAIDLNLFDRGVFQTATEAHQPLAELWMQVGGQMGVKPAAGYYFTPRPDGNHYSCEWNGVK